MFITIWEYHVLPQHQPAFERAYGPEGGWVQLFRRGTGHLRTELLRDAGDGGRYVTVDYWTSRASRDAFRRQFADAFAALDAACEALTEGERWVGDFEAIEE